MRGGAAVLAVNEDLGGPAVLTDGITRVQDKLVLEDLLARLPMAGARPVGDLDRLAVLRARDCDAGLPVKDVEHGAVRLEVVAIDHRVAPADDPEGAVRVFDVVADGALSVGFGEGLEVFD